MTFLHNTVKRIVHGFGCISQAADEVRNLGGTRALVVTDPGLAKIGVQKPLEEALEKGGIPCSLYADVELEPSVESIARCADAAKSFGADIIFGIGGGSALDTTKAAAVLLTNEGTIDQYFGMGKVKNPLPPLVLVPTTAGTGSEMTSISVLADTVNGGKWGVVSDHMYASSVMLDPELTLGLPPAVTAMTGIDAFVHAMESFCGKADTPITNALNLEAMRLIARSIRRAYVNGGDRQARADMLYASTLAGMGFSNTQNGIIHAVGTAIPREYHLPHGLAIACLTPMCVEFNYMARPEKYAQVAEILGEKPCGDVLETAAKAHVRLAALLKDLDIKAGVQPYGVKFEDLPLIAQRAAGNVRLIGNNPRPATAKQIQAMLEASWV
ncbi:MAG: iron-containing alcohol dehydrogenase [Desulfovibrionaceae bacterium]|nr:iron-containing alcohol dehydrogenase [Desulfovibrionaceae bacterium]